MFREPIANNTMVPLILRVGLGVIFIYHGVTKVTGPNTELGARWADVYWEAQHLPPADLEAKADQLFGSDTDGLRKFQDQLHRVYSQDAKPIPDSLHLHSAQYAVAWGELLGGVAMLVGLLTRLAAVGLIIIQIGAIVTVTSYHGFSSPQGGYEYNVALLAACLVLLLTGAGHWSLDWIMAGKRRALVQKQHPVLVA